MKRTAVYRHYNADGELLYVGMSANPTRRLSEHNSRSGRRNEVARVDIDWFDSKEAAAAVEAQAVRELKPRDNAVGPRFQKQSKTDSYLSQYLIGHKITQSEFAAQIGVTQATVSRLCSGKTPSLRLAAKIHDATAGAVPFETWQPS